MTGLWPAGWRPVGDKLHSSGNYWQPLILTAALPPALQAAAQFARSPEAARHAPAHLTLFRHLPGKEADAILRDVKMLVAGQRAPVAEILEPRLQGSRWLAPVKCDQLLELREELAERWHGLLAPGDEATPILHISLGSDSQSERPAECAGRPDSARKAPLDAKRAALPGPTRPKALPAGPWRLPGLLLWQYGEALWSPLVAVAFRG